MAPCSLLCWVNNPMANKASLSSLVRQTLDLLEGVIDFTLDFVRLAWLAQV